MTVSPTAKVELEVPDGIDHGSEIIVEIALDPDVANGDPTSVPSSPSSSPLSSPSLSPSAAPSPPAATPELSGRHSPPPASPSPPPSPEAHTKAERRRPVEALLAVSDDHPEALAVADYVFNTLQHNPPGSKPGHANGSSRPQTQRARSASRESPRGGRRNSDAQQRQRYVAQAEEQRRLAKAAEVEHMLSQVDTQLQELEKGAELDPGRLSRCVNALSSTGWSNPFQ